MRFVCSVRVWCSLVFVCLTSVGDGRVPVENLTVATNPLVEEEGRRLVSVTVVVVVVVRSL